jgi:2-polyprenyl-3-methyl-5-hydroxy-6-metoxy-1,4-benzoquinol methylase
VITVRGSKVRGMEGEERAAFARRMLDVLTGSALSMLVSVGYRSGLFEAAAKGPATSEELAERAGLQERYVREWLGAMVTGGFFDYDAASGEYELPAAHAAALTGDRAANIAPMASTLRAFGGALPDLERSLRDGGGLSHSVFAPHFEAAGAGAGDSWRRIYDEQLVGGFIGAVDGLAARLAAGARVLDLGCGSGHAVNVLARAFPESCFVGADIDRRVIELAEAERAALGLRNVTFEVADAAQLQPGSPFDVITSFDAVHDQHSPAQVLSRVRAALSPGGMFVMVDAKFSSHLENNIGNPFAPLCYAISLLYCTPVSLADGGAGLGAMWGTELACQMLADAGFTDVTVLDSPRPQNCIYVCRT